MSVALLYLVFCTMLSVDQVSDNAVQACVHLEWYDTTVHVGGKMYSKIYYASANLAHV